MRIEFPAIAHPLGEGGEMLCDLAANEELDEDDIVNMINETNNRDNDSDEEESKSATFTAKINRRGVELGRKLGNFFQQNDSNVERVPKFQRDINNSLAHYAEVCKDLTKNQTQLLILDFNFKRQPTELVPNSLTLEPESYQMLASDESDIIQTNKKRLRVYESDGIVLKRMVKMTKHLIKTTDPEVGTFFEVNHLEDSENEAQILLEENLLDGLSNWLDRLFEGTTHRYYINYWPDFSTK